MRLEVNDLHVRYGRVHAVRGVSLAVETGEMVAVLGANGAGKSSLLKALMGLEPAAEGTVTLDGTDITRWPPSRRVRQHLVLVPEGRRIVTSLTVHENLLMGAFARKDTRSVGGRDRTKSISDFPTSRRGGTRRPRCCRAASSRCWRSAAGCWPTPKLMMLDEPSLGLSPRLTNEVFALIARTQSLARPCDPAGRAEYSQGAGARQSRLCAGAWPQGDGGRCPPNCATILPCATPIWDAPSRAKQVAG